MGKKKGEHKQTENDILVYLRELQKHYVPISKNAAYCRVSEIGWNEGQFVWFKTQ